MYLLYRLVGVFRWVLFCLFCTCLLVSYLSMYTLLINMKLQIKILENLVCPSSDVTSYHGSITGRTFSVNGTPYLSGNAGVIIAWHYELPKVLQKLCSWLAAVFATVYNLTCPLRPRLCLA